jgi:restriction endonuclease S subunit
MDNKQFRRMKNKDSYHERFNKVPSTNFLSRIYGIGHDIKNTLNSRYFKHKTAKKVEGYEVVKNGQIKSYYLTDGKKRLFINFNGNDSRSVLKSSRKKNLSYINVAKKGQYSGVDHQVTRFFSKD